MRRGVYSAAAFTGDRSPVVQQCRTDQRAHGPRGRPPPSGPAAPCGWLRFPPSIGTGRWAASTSPAASSGNCGPGRENGLTALQQSAWRDRGPLASQRGRWPHRAAGGPTWGPRTALRISRTPPQRRGAWQHEGCRFGKPAPRELVRLV